MKKSNRESALITGGSRGIGREVAIRLAQSGTRTIVINYLQNDEAAASTKEKIEQQGAKCVLARANLAYSQEISGLFEKVRSAVETIDVFVHSAALGSFKPLINVKPNQWDLSFNVNTRSFLQCVQQCRELMNSGRVVAISSLGARRALPNYGAIGPSKAALEACIRQLAVELAPEQIRINGVSAGLVETDSIKNFPDYVKLVSEVKNRTPAGRVADPSDIADVVMYLLSDKSDWIWGQTIVADGGLSLL